MTTEPESQSEQQGASAAPPHSAPPLDDQLPPAAAHSTPVRKEQGGGAEDDGTSHWSSSSKLTRSPVKISRKPRNMQVKVALLDGSDYTCVVEKRDKGQVLFDKVCEHLNLLEKDYFGVTFRDVENQKNWLDPAKDMKKQIRGVAWNFSFSVKFYPPEPALLSEDITRYYLCLQLRDDIVSGRLPCSFATHMVLGSYTVQSELGDYDPDDYSSDYVSEFRFAPHQTKEMEEKIMDLHKNYRGMTPAEAEMHFLENVKKLSMYGVDLHHAKLIGRFFHCFSPAKAEDSEGVEIMLGVCSSGLLIYRDRLRINRFAWPKVLKISYKRNNFYIKIRPGEFEQFESTIGFKLPNHRAAKRLWKVSVEHHTFFRLVSPETPPKKFLTLGSKFRYSGRTQAQTRRASSQIVRPAPYFERSTSKRYTMSQSLDGAQRTPVNSATVNVNGTRPAEMGTALYGAAKGIAISDLITTITPEKKVEETHEEEHEETRPVLVESAVLLEEEDETTKATEPSLPSPLTPARQDTRTDLTDTAVDEELTATESDQEDESEAKTQEMERTPEELLKHQTNISELRRTFLEGGPDHTALTEWEKRLSSSPLRSPRLDEAPMIEPLEPDEIKQEAAVKIQEMAAAALEPQEEKVDVPKPSFDEMSPELTALLQSTRSWAPSASAASIALHKSSESPESHLAEKEDQQPPAEGLQPQVPEPPEGPWEPAVCYQVCVACVEPLSSVRALDESESEDDSSDSSSVNSDNFSGPLTHTDPTRADSHSDSESGGESFSLSTDEDDDDDDEQSPKRSTSEQRGVAEGHSGEVELTASLESGVVSFSRTLSGDTDTQDTPVIHTEMKTITYESLQGETDGDADPGILLSAQTITSETSSTSTTTHITKAVKGGISETRIEKRIVISGDADIDHDKALAQAIKEAKEQHPDMSVTKVVVHKETEITPEE
ncbi:band 4.1-like protein 3 isoform X10 [Carassius carassius]|uniref:band 4.1-like protein 3 isoform X10 n=1 Tax=Carassius carassius TaxID=217509 RepID=UPI0028687168|nr:band 4.1-like protein 3 isoform X10 [Carassius carassius]